MLRIISVLFVFILLSAQTPMLPGFPPGTFQSRAALDAPVAGAAYVGPGDVVASAKAWYGLRAYSSATRGNAAVRVCDGTGGVVNGACVDLLTNATTGALVPQSNIGTNLITCPGTVTCIIQKIYDQTVGGNCGGSCDLVQTAAFNDAQLISNCINTTLPCMRSDTVGTVGIYFTAGNFTLAQPYTIPLTVSLPTAATGIFVDDSNFNVQPIAFVSGTSVRVFAGSNQDTVVSYNTSHNLLSINNNAGTSFLVVDGTNNTLGSIGAASFGSAGAAPLALGDKVQIKADFTEFGIWGSAFTTTAVTGQAVLMCHNQFAYWGTATSC